MMKRTFWLIALSLLSLTLSASDSLRIHNPQIPILLDRMDNVLFQIRVPDAVRGDVLESLTVEFGPDTDIKSMAELRLFYSGTEAVRRQGCVSARWNISLPIMCGTHVPPIRHIQ